MTPPRQPPATLYRQARRRRPSLARRVQQQILDYVRNAQLRPGDRLPTESELCERFNVSRTALREAMKYLEIMGVVSIEPGRGTFLTAFDVGELLRNLPMQLLFQKNDVLEVIRVRQALEEFCLEQAITRADDGALDELGRLVERMKERAAAGESMEAEDIAFHRQLARMAGTRLLLMVLEIFWDLRRRWPQDNRAEALHRRYLRHLRIYESMKRRDLQLARMYLVEHFRGGYEELLKEIGDPSQKANSRFDGDQTGGRVD